MKLPVYLDHSATTPVLPDVIEAMLPYFSDHFGNSSALYAPGQAAHEAVELARDTMARALNASPDEIIFTSGGTESDNTALRGVALAASGRGKHLLTTPFEHHAILVPLERLASEGFEVEHLPVDSEGKVSPEEVEKRIRRDTTLVSVMHVNNEVGTIQDIAAIGRICRDHGVFFHTDAVQSFGKLPIDVRKMKIDMLSLSAHKLYGPKGIGALFARRGVPLAAFQLGGGQEKGRRSGTLNVPGIVGLAKATALAMDRMADEAARLSELRDRLVAQIEQEIPGVALSGSRKDRLPGHIHITIDGVDGEAVLLGLDQAGICASAGSACSAGSTEPSHVLKAMGFPNERSRSALRLTMGVSTDAEVVEYTGRKLAEIVCELRKLSS